jgi:hypothetical protein
VEQLTNQGTQKTRWALAAYLVSRGHMLYRGKIRGFKFPTRIIYAC